MSRSIPKVGGIVIATLALAAAMAFWIIRPMFADTPVEMDPSFPVPGKTAGPQAAQNIATSAPAQSGSLSLTHGSSTDTMTRAIGLRPATAAKLAPDTQNSSVLDVLLPGQSTTTIIGPPTTIDLTTPVPPIEENMAPVINPGTPR